MIPPLVWKGVERHIKKYLKEEKKNIHLHQFLVVRKWKCAKLIRYANPNRPVGALFINSQYLSGCIHEYSWADRPDTHTTLQVNVFVFMSDVSTTCLNHPCTGTSVGTWILHILGVAATVRVYWMLDKMILIFIWISDSNLWVHNGVMKIYWGR